MCAESHYWADQLEFHHALEASWTGLTANGLPFDANPQRIWRVTEASATINGQDVGPSAPLPEQARLGDFWIPQQGIFAMGRVFVGA